MLTASDGRTSKTAKMNKLYYYRPCAAHRRTSMFSNITKFFTLKFAVFCQFISSISCMSISIVLLGLV